MWHKIYKNRKWSGLKAINQVCLTFALSQGSLQFQKLTGIKTYIMENWQRKVLSTCKKKKLSVLHIIRTLIKVIWPGFLNIKLSQDIISAAFSIEASSQLNFLLLCLLSCLFFVICCPCNLCWGEDPETLLPSTLKCSEKV